MRATVARGQCGGCEGSWASSGHRVPLRVWTGLWAPSLGSHIRKGILGAGEGNKSPYEQSLPVLVWPQSVLGKGGL